MINLFALSFLGSSFFAFTVGAIHWIRKDLPAVSSALSKYALGSYGRLLTAGIYSIGFAEILLSLGLAKSSGLGLGNIFLMLAGVGAIVVATFKIELPKKTFGGYLHDLGAEMQFLFFPFALLQLEALFFQDSLRIFTNTIAYSNLFLSLLISYLYVSKTTSLQKYFGAIQKSNILFMNVWVMVTSFLLV